MTLVVSSLDRIARQCGVKKPGSWVNATRDEHLEIRDDFLSETIEDILDRATLPSPISKTVTLTAGTGTTNSVSAGLNSYETFSLPADFKRIHRDHFAFYDTLQDRPVIPVSSDGGWANLTDLGASGVIKHFRLAGYEGNYTIDLYRSQGTTILHYVANVWMANNQGTVGNSFTSDEDVLILPRRLLETGTVWRQRERRGLPYQDKMTEYEVLLERTRTDARNLRTIQFAPPDKKIRWQDAVPAFIPPS